MIQIRKPDSLAGRSSASEELLKAVCMNMFKDVEDDVDTENAASISVGYTPSCCSILTVKKSHEV